MNKSCKILFLLFVSFLYGCDNKNPTIKEENVLPKIKNDFPVIFWKRVILEYKKPFTNPEGNTVLEDTFSIYSLYNRSVDTVFVLVIHRSNDNFLKDTNIKNVYLGDSRSSHKKNTDSWGLGIICEFGPPDSVRLLPNQFVRFQRFADPNKYDSVSYNNIPLIIKKGKIMKPLRIKKKFVLDNKGEFIEDLNAWSND